MNAVDFVTKFRDTVNSEADALLDQLKQDGVDTDPVTPGAQVFCVVKKATWRNMETVPVLVKIFRTKAAAEKSAKTLNELTKDAHSVETHTISPE
jgi:hypothetical protein